MGDGGRALVGHAPTQRWVEMVQISLARHRRGASVDTSPFVGLHCGSLARAVRDCAGCNGSGLRGEKGRAYAPWGPQCHRLFASPGSRLRGWRRAAHRCRFQPPASCGVLLSSVWRSVECFVRFWSVLLGSVRFLSCYYISLLFEASIINMTSFIPIMFTSSSYKPNWRI